MELSIIHIIMSDIRGASFGNSMLYSVQFLFITVMADVFSICQFVNVCFKVKRLLIDGF